MAPPISLGTAVAAGTVEAAGIVVLVAAGIARIVVS